MLNYLAHRRRIIAVDEWGFYIALAGLYFSQELVLFALVLFYGGICLWISYQAYWRLEEKILEKIPTNGEADGPGSKES